MIERSVRAGDPFAHAGDVKTGEHPPTGSTPTTREQRGLALFRERGAEIAHVRGSAWAVPSSDATRAGVYLVDLDGHACTCGDRPPAGEVCKHATAATVAHAKSGGCSGGGRRFPRRELLELVEGEHDNLTFFDGDLLCPACAGGVA